MRYTLHITALAALTLLSGCIKEADSAASDADKFANHRDTSLTAPTPADVTPECNDPDVAAAVREMFVVKLLAAGGDSRARSSGLLSPTGSLTEKFNATKPAAINALTLTGITSGGYNPASLERFCKANLARASDPSLVVPTRYTLQGQKDGSFNVQPQFITPDGEIGFNLLVAFQSEVLRAMYSKELAAK